MSASFGMTLTRRAGYMIKKISTKRRVPTTIAAINAAPERTFYRFPPRGKVPLAIGGGLLRL
jgi:hypothetical protein